MKGSAGIGLALVGVGMSVAAGAVIVTACSGDDNPGRVPSTIITTVEAGTVYGDAGAPCLSPPGTVPNPLCDDGTEAFCSPPPSPPCDLSKCQAVSTTAGSCEPMATNPSAGPWDFRMRRIIIVAPPNLATSTVQNSVVTDGVDLNEPQCGEEGTGDFSWLIHLDTTNPSAMTVKTGGAPPCDLTNPTAASPFAKCDPYNTGYCFLTQDVGSIHVAPITAPVLKASDGSYVSPNLGDINIPIFYNGSIIVLPIKAGSVAGVKVTDNGNCIGSFNPAAMDVTCGDSYQNCSKWLTAGSLTGYITLEQADQVQVDLLSKTLCVVLTGTAGVVPAGGGNATCQRDSTGAIIAKGNYCSTTTPPAPGGCQDSFWLAATFAASAVKITGDCAGDGG